MPISNPTTIPSQNYRVRAGMRIVVICVAVSCIYPMIADAKTDFVAFINAIGVGLIAGLGIAYHQDYLTYRKKLRRRRLLVRAGLSALLYTIGMALIILAVYVVNRSLEAGVGPYEFIQAGGLIPFLLDDYFIIVGWSLILILILTFTFNMSRQVTGNLLANMIFGKYANPREEFRFVMNLDLTSATTIAERLGPIRYCQFLNDFYTAITPAIIAANGEIYRYVGDQVTITWKNEKHFDPAWCVRMFFLANNLLDEWTETFADRYGLIPRFKAALHCGEFVVGEIGDLKCQLVLHGDAMYETQRIETECTLTGNAFLVSEVYLSKTDLPGIYGADRVKSLQFGENEIQLYAITEKEAGVI